MATQREYAMTPDGSTLEELARIVLILDDVASGGVSHYAEWQRTVLVPALNRLPGTERVIAFRATSEMPGGVARGLVFPPFMTIVHLKSDADGDGDAVRRIAAASPPSGAVPVIRHAFSEFNRGQRNGAFLSQSSPRTVFLIGQRVDTEKEGEYNYWFDVDDRKTAAGAEKISHFRERLSFPGFIRATRMKYAEPQSPQDVDSRGLNYIALYEVERPEALQSDAYLEASQRPADRRGLFTLVVRSTYVEVNT